MTRRQWTIMWVLGLVVVAIVAAVVVSSRGGDDVDAVAPVTSAPVPEAATSTVPPTSTTTPPPTDVPPTTAGTTTTVLPTTTTAPPVGAPALVLIPDGFESIPFGFEPEDVIARLVASFGDPTQDTGWIPSADLGPCPGDDVRVVSWGELSLLFTDEVTPFAAPGARHFTSWIYTGPATPDDVGLRTAEGVGLGSTLADLEAAYGERLQVFEDDIFGTTFRVDWEDGGEDYVYLSGALTDTSPGAVVIGLSAGRSCGE